MAFEGQQPVKLIGVVAGVDLSAATVAYKFVKFTNTTSSGQSLCAATTDVPSGVIQAPAPTTATGQPVEVVALGQTKLQSDGTVQVGQIIGCDASGRATPCLATMYPVGRCVANEANEPVTAAALISAVVNCIAPTVKA
jgi:hypothetical protein